MDDCALKQLIKEDTCGIVVILPSFKMGLILEMSKEIFSLLPVSVWISVTNIQSTFWTCFLSVPAEKYIKYLIKTGQQQLPWNNNL